MISSESILYHSFILSPILHFTYLKHFCLVFSKNTDIIIVGDVKLKTKKTAVVLSGGGAKGAYQIGVWKAFKKMNIKYDIVTGTSIGSLNGLMMVQNDYHKATYLWKHTNFDEIFGIDFKKNSKRSKVYLYREFLSNFIRNGGVGTEKMLDFINEVYDERKFKNSNVDYGIVTVNFTQRKAMNILKSENNPDLLKYVLASCTCYPAFKKTKINEEEYIDGGYSDNLPINLAIELGATDIIAVDLGAIGVKRKANKDVNIKYISPKNELGSFLMFHSNDARRARKYGYNDALNAYNKWDGNRYRSEVRRVG